MNHNTFSMQNILNEPLNPDLCKRILQEIKSPLLQQSFAMTNDESFSNSLATGPKRPDIPPPSWSGNQYRGPAIKSKFNTFANGQSFYDESGNYCYQNNNHGIFTENRNFLDTLTKKYDGQIENTNRVRVNDTYGQKQSRVQMQLVVSPLDPNITQKKPESTDFINDIWSHFCGDVHDLTYDQNHQVNYNQAKSKFQRKKIFNQRALNILQQTQKNNGFHYQIESILLFNQNNHKSHIQIQNDSKPKITEKSVVEVLDELRRNRHFQIASFVGFLTSSIGLLKSAQKQRKFLVQNIEMVFQLVSSSNFDFEGLIEDNLNYQKLFSRMKCSSITEMIKKISRNKLIQIHNSDLKQYNRQKINVSDSLETMLQAFVQIEQKIEQFLQEEDSINKLKKVYSVLCQKFTKNTTRSKNLINLGTLEQIMNLLRDVRLFSYENEAFCLEYFWDSFSSSLLSQSQFINGLVKTNGRYKDEKLDTKGAGFEVQLSQMGFMKN